MFAPLQQLAFFKSFTLAPGGYGIVWNEDIDISEYELWRHVTAPKAEVDLRPAGIASEHFNYQPHKC
jgi:hypothetical protein